MKKREIPIKNYITLALVILGTVFLTFRLAEQYKIDKEYFKSNSSLAKIISEVKPKELENYLLENPNIVIYIVNGNDDNGEETDKIIKEIVLEYDLTDEIVVMDITSNLAEVRTELKKLLSQDLEKYKDDLLEITNLLVINEGKIEDILTPKNIVKEDIVNFLIKNGVM